MLGHIFATSGAVCVAIAPDKHRVGNYIVLARHQDGDLDQYVVAKISDARVIEAVAEGKTGPDSWNYGSYFPLSHREEAIEEFREETEIATDAFALGTQVEHTERILREAGVIRSLEPSA